ncbi:MAG: hypothetical protein EZS28_004029 [Streblomastix strix]|uniref:Uncharacterized protein n=1 Tax=Streblomastix strix TaxID=222440 RepID=A0A5J4X135_9EUKA|nr:MAG: hypothetical protein EZS28_004029 [Streblomastix strix]
MHSEQQIQEEASAIISFSDSYTQNKERKLNEQQDSESISSLTDITSPLDSLSYRIQYIHTCKQVIQIPKFLQSITALSLYKVGSHLREEIDLLRLKVRSLSRRCLFWIQDQGDEQVQSELINNGYGRLMAFTLSTAGGQGEEQDKEIFYGLDYIYHFLRDLYEGRNNEWQTSLQPLPLLVQLTEEQIEEEGANEEIEAQMNNNGYYGNIMTQANRVKAETLNRFIYKY